MASIRKRERSDGSISYAVLHVVDGHQSSDPFDDLKSAEWFRDMVNLHGGAKARELAGYGKPVHAAPAEKTVTEYLNHYVDHLTGKEAGTLYNYRSYIKRDIDPVLGRIPLSQLSRDNVATWVQAMEDTEAAPKTISNKVIFLASALNDAVKRDQIPANPAHGIGVARGEPREMVFLTREEFAIVLAAVTERWRPMVEFLVASGCRWGEATALRPSDVDRDAGTVRITRAWKRTVGQRVGYKSGAPKTRKSRRTIDIGASTLDKLDYSGEWLFTSRRGTPVRGASFRGSVWLPAIERARAQGLTKQPRVHDLRHTCASWLIQAGIPLPVVQQHLGHENISTTVGVYGHLDRQSAARAADAIAKALKH